MISNEIKNNKIVLVTVSKEKYVESLSVLYPELVNSVDKLGYVTINKPFNSIIDLFKKNKLDVNKLFFVDVITATVQSPPKVDNCIFVSSPSALTDLGLAFSSLLAEQNCDLVFFDTISTLLIYQDIGTVTKFIHNVVTKARVLDKRIIFLSLSEDSDSLIKDMNMFVDKVVEL